MGLFDKIKDAASTASDMVAKANEFVDRSETAIAGRRQENAAVAPSGCEAVSPAPVSSAGQKALGAFDSSGYMLIHDEDQLVDSVCFPNPSGIDEDEVIGYFDEQITFAGSDERVTGDFWNIGMRQYSFDEQPGVAQGATIAFVPVVSTCHVFYGILYDDSDGDLRFDIRRQYNSAATITPADAARYDDLRKMVDGFLETDDLLGWPHGAAKRLMEPAYYVPGEIVQQGSRGGRETQGGASDTLVVDAPSQSSQARPTSGQKDQASDSAAKALALIEAARQGLPAYVPDPEKEKRFADLKSAIGFVKNHFLQPGEGFKLLGETGGADMYVLSLENKRGDIQYTLATGNRGGSTSLILIATIFAGTLRDDVSDLDVYRVFDALYQQTLLSYFGPGRLCPQIEVGDSGERKLVATADVWFTSEIRRLNDSDLFARSEFVVPTLLANRIDTMEAMFHDPVVVNTLGALCQ